MENNIQIIQHKIKASAETFKTKERNWVTKTIFDDYKFISESDSEFIDNLEENSNSEKMVIEQGRVGES